MKNLKIAMVPVFGALATLTIAGSFYGSSLNAQPRTLAAGGNAVSYCWKNEAGFHFCYGPTQRTSAGEKDLSIAIDYSGCKQPDQQQYSGASGVCRGAFYICRGTQLQGYHNDEKRIRGWLADRGC